MYRIFQILLVGGMFYLFGMYYLINDNMILRPINQEQAQTKGLECLEKSLVKSERLYNDFKGFRLNKLNYLRLEHPSSYSDLYSTLFYTWDSPLGPKVITQDLRRFYYFIGESYACQFPILASKREVAEPRSMLNKIFTWILLLGGTVFILKNQALFLPDDNP